MTRQQINSIAPLSTSNVRFTIWHLADHDAVRFSALQTGLINQSFIKVVYELLRIRETFSSAVSKY